ncbi:hypothetical protein [Macrococcoides canis]|uniref:hypothetical protein n=1 Tax=Macrococcoides canis TaxID=1855823 RepID=UPI0010620419|nr:hypothetical protein [Macrococcus canis]TDM24309.1 hypothetical protein ETI02_00505 [Macrococcus canis]
MVDRLKAGFTIYDKHSSELSLEVYDYTFPTPQMREIKETIPFMDGEYDFSFLYGEPTYNERIITMDSRCYINDYEKRTKHINYLKEWLIGKPKNKFISEFYPGLEFNMRCSSFEFDITPYGFDLKLIFTGDSKAKMSLTGKLVI